MYGKIKLEDVLRAKNDNEVYGKIYKQVFFDNKNNNKVRKWLIKKGVSFNEVDDVYGIMVLVFANAILSYKHDKIYFEKYVWVKFGHRLNNYFSDKNLLKNSNILIEENNSVQNYTLLPSEDFDIDLFIESLDSIKSLIAKCHLYYGWTKNEIVDFISHLEYFDYEKEIDIIKIYVDKYLKGEL